VNKNSNFSTKRKYNASNSYTIDIERFYYDGDKTSSIPFYQQIEQNNFLIDINGYACFKWMDSLDCEFKDFDNINISVSDSNGEVYISDAIFNAITKNIEFKWI